MSHRPSNYFGATAAWLCLAPVAFARETLLMPNTLAPACTSAHNVVNVYAFLIWITGGMFLAVGGFLAFTPSPLRTRKSYPLSALAQGYRCTEIGLAWTVIPLLVLLLFLG